ILKTSTDNTVELLKKELKIKLGELEDQWHNASLERIFIENKIYRDIEDKTTWEGVLSAIDQGLKPYVKDLKREVVDDDLVRLTEIKIKRISKFDTDKADEKILNLEIQIKKVKSHLDDIINYSIAYFQRLKKDYSKNRERKTEIRIFDDVDAKKVVIRNTKLYVNRVEGFVGTSMRKDEYVCDCSDIDDIIVFTENGRMIITKVDTKTFIDKNIIHVAVFKKKDKRTIYNMIYRDGDKGYCYLKRFPVYGITRDKPYSLIRSKKDGVVKYFSANPNGEAEKVTISLRKNPKLKKLKWDVDFSNYMIKGRMTRGNQITKHNVKRIELKEKGISTLKPRKIWFDDTVQRLNVDARGDLLGEFRGEDKILVVLQNGSLKIIDPDMSAHFNDDMIVLEKWMPKKPLSVVYFDGKKQRFFVKRFLVENENKHEKFITEHKDSFLELISTDWRPVIDVVFNKIRNKTQKPNQVIELEQFISIKGIKAIGNQLSSEKIKQINTLEAIEYEPPVEMPADEIEVFDEKIVEDKDVGQKTLF
ncbi:MAG: DNA gyrase/topoisomerase IV subunit A, partial [Flavobacteriaceae bacterium]